MSAPVSSALLSGKLKRRVENPDQPELFSKQAAPQPDDVGPGLFDTAAERQAREDAQSHEDKLLGDHLTAQFKSGLPMRPAKIKPKKAGNLFEDAGPEQGGLFSLVLPDDARFQDPNRRDPPWGQKADSKIIEHDGRKIVAVNRPGMQLATELLA